MMKNLATKIMGHVFPDLYTTIKCYMHPSLTRSSTLRLLAEKVEPLIHLFAAIDARYPEAGAHRETRKLRELLGKADKMVHDCGGLRWWNLRRKRRISKRLTELTASFERLLNEDFGLVALMCRQMVVQGEQEELKAELNAKLDRLLAGQAELNAKLDRLLERNWKLDRMYVGRQVAPARLSAGGGGMRDNEIHYEMTEEKCLSISGCCGGHDGYDGDGDGKYFDRRGDYNSKWE